MFSGIVETIGVINYMNTSNDCLHLTITPQIPFADTKVGDSISINGVCLTVTSFTSDNFNVTVVPETLRLTNLNRASQHSLVNLERSLKVGDRIGGHYVQGHVDAVGEIIEFKQDGLKAHLVTISIPSTLEKYIVKKGYITVDGMSLTVIDVTLQAFSLTLIPHTKTVTKARAYQVGDKVNIEVDILGKYVEKLLGRS